MRVQLVLEQCDLKKESINKNINDITIHIKKANFAIIELDDENEDKRLVAITSHEGILETAAARTMEMHEAQTRPPARFTEATLLSAMEGAGKLVEDEELREAMSQRGLGTPATRAAIIEG
jgi:DNA topoisomerase-3